jgi:hypothetical protein
MTDASHTYFLKIGKLILFVEYYFTMPYDLQQLNN